MSHSKFTASMEKKIQQQKDQVKKRYNDFRNRKIEDVSNPKNALSFYWGNRYDAKTCGAAAYTLYPDFCFPILPQLLITPHLIVDILPLPFNDFVRCYGVTPAQMYELVASGFVVPNIYHYSNNGWRDYVHYRKLWPILTHEKTRINSLWISAYLDLGHRFSDEKANSVAFFRKHMRNIYSSEKKRILQALGDETTPLGKIPDVCGHRLAYLKTIGEQRCNEIVQEIEAKWQSNDTKPYAIRLLNATKELSVDALTAAYGGRSHLAEPLYRQIIITFPSLVLIPPNTPPPEIFRKVKERLADIEQAEFCAEVANELDKLRLFCKKPKYSSPVTSGVFPLDKSRFKQFLRTLERPTVQSGDWGKWADEIADFIQSKKKRPDLQYYREIWRDIDSHLKSTPNLAAALGKISQIFFFTSGCFAKLPPIDAEDLQRNLQIQIVLDFLGSSAKFLATKAKDTIHLKLWKLSVPRSLCRRWRRIKTERKSK